MSICGIYHRSHVGHAVISAQDSLMKSRDERVALMNEILGAVRMLKVSILILSRAPMTYNIRIVYGLGEEFREARTEDS